MMTAKSGPMAINRRGIAMPIIKDAFEYGLHGKRRGFYQWQALTEEDLMILTNLNDRLKKKFNIKKLVPYPLLQFFWDIGFLPIMQRPIDRGIRVPAFLDLLSRGEYKNSRHQFQGIWLRDTIEKEVVAVQMRRSEKYIGKTNHGKLWPASFLRKQPGTMIK